MSAKDPIMVVSGGQKLYYCPEHPGYRLHGELDKKYPQWWLVITDDAAPKVKANLGICSAEEAKVRFYDWLKARASN